MYQVILIILAYLCFGTTAVVSATAIIINLFGAAPTLDVN